MAHANNAPPISSTTTSQLFFDVTGGNKTVSQDDFGTTPNFASITLSTSGYSLLHAGAAINGIGGGISATNASGINNVDILMQLSSNQSWTQAAGGTLNVINNFNVNGKTLSFPGGGNVKLAASGNISGSGAMNVNGTGTVTVNGAANTYSGTASVSAGKLVIASNLGSAITVTGGTLTGTATVASIDASSGNGVVEAGSGTGTGSLTASGSSTLSSTASLQTDLSANGVNGKLVTNSLTLGSAALVINDLYGASLGHSWTIASSSSVISGQLTNGGLAILSGVKFTQGSSAYHLTYTGGAGNDIVLTSDGPNTAPTINIGSTTTTASAAEGATVTLSVNFTDPDMETHSLKVDWGDTASSPLTATKTW